MITSYFRPAIPLLISLICGILLGSGLAGYEIWATAAAIVCTGFCLRQIIPQKKCTYPSDCAFCFPGLPIRPTLGISQAACQSYPSLHGYPSLGYYRANRQCTSEINNRTRFHLQVTSLGGDGQTRVVSGKLRVTAVGDIPDLSVGDWVRFNSRIRSLTNFKNPGGFDYKKYMAFKGIRATAYC